MIIVSVAGDGRLPTQQILVTQPHALHRISIRAADGSEHVIGIAARWVTDPDDLIGEQITVQIEDADDSAE